MQTILLVEDTNFFAKAVTRLFMKSEGFEVVVAGTFAQAAAILRSDPDRFFVALVDLTLPDASDAEIVNLTVSARVPTIVFSSRYDETLRSTILAKGVVDYVLKDSPASLTYLRDLVFRLRNCSGVGALVVGDDSAELTLIAEHLRRLKLSVHVARSGADALAMFRELADIRLVVHECSLPDMDGIDFLKRIRSRRGPEKVAVMGLSGALDPTRLGRFLKFGADDILPGDCSPEEFMLRVGQNLDMLQRIADLTEAANVDPMTRLRNRRYLFEAGARRFDACRKEKKAAAVALFDIDHFKRINDRFGHEAGDVVIKHFARELQRCDIDGAIAARLGGDEFCLLMPGCGEDRALAHCREIVSRFTTSPVGYRSTQIDVTLSVGVSTGFEADLDEALRVADARMYGSKKLGRNRIGTGNATLSPTAMPRASVSTATAR